jgi:3-oxoadipate enol-lactonase
MRLLASGGKGRWLAAVPICRSYGRRPASKGVCDVKSDARKVSNGRAATRDGAHLAYTLHESGNRNRRAVLIHSIGMDRHFWQAVAERLARRGSILVYDCRGHGASAKPPEEYSVELFADDLADLLDHIGWRSAVIAGASMGGCIALAFAAAYPARTAALGLIDTTAWYGVDAPKQWADRAERAKRDGLASLLDFQTTRWFTDKFRAENPHLVRACVDTFLANDVAAYEQSCRMLGTADIRAALPRLKVPTAIIVGEQDYATPLAMAEELHRGIEGSSLTVLQGARHLTPVEQPDRIAAEIGRLLETAR